MSPFFDLPIFSFSRFSYVIVSSFGDLAMKDILGAILLQFSLSLIEPESWWMPYPSFLVQLFNIFGHVESITSQPKIATSTPLTHHSPDLRVPSTKAYTIIGVLKLFFIKNDWLFGVIIEILCAGILKFLLIEQTYDAIYNELPLI